MASRIAGITVEINGNVTGLNKALESVNKTIKNTQSQLKDVERLLKLDPTNTQLLTQKQGLLKDSIAATKDKLDALKTAQEQAKTQMESGDLGKDKYDALQREIIATEQELEKLAKEAANANQALTNLDSAGKAWNVLLERYESITIGAVQTYLSAALAASQEKAVEKAVAISNSTANADYVTKTTFNALSGAVGNAQRDIYHLQDFEEAITGVGGGYVVITIDENKQTDCLYILIDSPVLSAAKKVYRWNEEGLSYTAGGIEKGSWVNIAGSDGKLSAGFLKGVITDVLGKNSWNLESGVFSLSDETIFGGKTLEENVNSLLPDVDGTVQDAINSYDEGLNQEAMLSKLQNGDMGFYLGEDGLLHMLPERVVSDGANITICYLPTTILDGKVTSYREVSVVNGIIYPVDSEGVNTNG